MSKRSKRIDGPEALDAELSASVMHKKGGSLIDRQKAKVQAPVEAFTFTPSFTEGGGASMGGAYATTQGGGGAGSGRRSVVRQPPDNFDMTMNSKPGTAGSYFKNQRTHQQQQPSVPRGGVTMSGDVDVVQDPAGKTGTKSGTTGSGRLPPLDRQAELEEGARQRALQALAEQEMEDLLRKEACQVQRQVERLKLQQRIKARIEKQLLSSQRPMDRSVATMGIDVDAILNRPKEQTFASQHRAELKDEPNAAFLHYNTNRMQHNMAHRAYCMQTLQERQRMRMALERTCHAYYPRQKEKQLEAIGADTTGACRFPTVAELHGQQQAAHHNQKQAVVDMEIIRQQTQEVAQRDDDLWAERCERYDQGLKTERVRELPFDVNRPYVKRADVKPSHFPVQVRASGSK